MLASVLCKHTTKCCRLWHLVDNILTQSMCNQIPYLPITYCYFAFQSYMFNNNKQTISS